MHTPIPALALCVAALAIAGCGSEDTVGSAPTTATTAAAPPLPSVPTNFVAQQGRPFAQPQVLRSHEGVLRTTFNVAPTTFTVAGKSVRGQSYAGQFLGPTLRVRPGDTIEIQLRNQLGKETNFHTHGLHTSPVGISDNVLRVMKTGTDNAIRIKVPWDIAPGTYWYHAHLHGLTEEQVFSGLAGALIVDGLTERLPAALRSVPDRLVALKDLQVKDGAIVTDNINSDAPTTRTVNGLVNPVIPGRPGEAQLLRLANMSADIWYRLKLDGARFQVLAEDANPVGRVWGADELVLPPGKRFDVLVRWPQAGTYRLRTLPYSTGKTGDNYPARTLATVQVAGDAVTPVALPTSMGTLPDLENDRIASQRKVVFSENTKTSQFFINSRQFNMDHVTEYVQLGTTEEWVIRNTSSEMHPFHIHVNDFQVMSINGRSHDAKSLQDVVPLPAHGRVVIRMRFRNFLGKYVFHCHILAHEDAGMMAIVDVTRDGKAPRGGSRSDSAMNLGM